LIKRRKKARFLVQSMFGTVLALPEVKREKHNSLCLI